MGVSSGLRDRRRRVDSSEAMQHTDASDNDDSPLRTRPPAISHSALSLSRKIDNGTGQVALP